MNPAETAELMETIALVRNKFGISILLIEHDMTLVMGICERLVVLEYGRVIAEVYLMKLFITLELFQHI